MKVGNMIDVTMSRLSADGGVLESKFYNTMDEAIADLPEIPPRTRASFPPRYRKLYDLAVAAGIKNPIPSYIDHCWYISGDNLDTEPIGFNYNHAAHCLSQGNTVYGSEFQTLFYSPA